MSLLYLNMKEDFDVCIVCLIAGVKMYKLEGQLWDSLTTIVQTNNCSELLPKYICYECCWLLHKAVNFRQRCQQAQHIFLQLLNNSDEVTKKTITNDLRKSIQSKLSPITAGEDSIINITYNDDIDRLTPEQVIIDEQNNDDYLVKHELSEHEEEHVEDVDDDTFQTNLSNCSDTDEVWTSIEIPVTKKTIINDHRKSVQIKLSPITTGKDSIINIPYNDDIDRLTPEQVIIDEQNNDDYLVKNELSEHEEEQVDDDTFQTNLSNCSDADEVWTPVEIPPKKKQKLNPKKNKRKKLTVIQKDRVGRKESRDANGLQPETVDLKTHFIISILSLEEQRAEIEHRKESSNYTQSPFKCDICYKGFLYQDTWTNHIAKHKPEQGRLVCPVCGLRFPSRRSLTAHSRRHERSYACTKCHFVTRHLDPAKKHKQWHEGVTYKCQQCGEVSNKLTSHLSHVRIKHPSPYVCAECGYSFVSDKGLKMHVARMHRDDSKDMEKKTDKEVGPASWECVECALTFKAEAAWRRHHATQHTTHSEAHLPLCRSCGVRFPGARELRAHNAVSHAASAEVRARIAKVRNPAPATYPAPCERCGAEIPDRKQHWRHYQKYHHELVYPLVRNYICEICGKGFKSNAYLVYHRRTHFPERLFRCPQCPKAFHNRVNLNLHVHTHSTSRPHACEHCGKSYKTRLVLTKHMRSHDNAAKEKRRQRKSTN